MSTVVVVSTVVKTEKSLIYLSMIIVRKILGPKRDEVRGIGGLSSEELCELFSSPSNNREMRSTGIKWAGHWHIMGRGAYSVFGGETIWKN